MSTLFDLTADEVEAKVARVPFELQHLFRGWLEGTHELDGEVIAPGNKEEQ